MVKPLNLNNLLDLDELSQVQQEYIKSLISYQITGPYGSGYYNLAFKVKNKQDYGVGYEVLEKELTQVMYKYVMLHLIESGAKGLKDSVVMEKVKPLLNQGPFTESKSMHIRKGILLGDDESVKKAQYLYQVVESIYG